MAISVKQIALSTKLLLGTVDEEAGLSRAAASSMHRGPVGWTPYLPPFLRVSSPRAIEEPRRLGARPGLLIGCMPAYLARSGPLSLPPRTHSFVIAGKCLDDMHQPQTPDLSLSRAPFPSSPPAIMPQPTTGEGPEQSDTSPPSHHPHATHYGRELVMVNVPPGNRGDVPLPIAVHANHTTPISPFLIPRRASGPLCMPCIVSPAPMPRRCSISRPSFSRLGLPSGLTSPSSSADPLGRRPGPGGARDICSAHAAALLPSSDILPHLDSSLQTWIPSFHFPFSLPTTVP